ncbi:MAG: 50S ribosomal protein L28 [Phascolarctobacterium sp.]|nr:50S ribosomal protein L28 [Candidatus Phascolarctobacterium equi]
MASFCDICGKTTQAGCLISHSNRHSNHTWKPNLQKVRAVVDGKVTRINVCTRCLRSGKVQRSI